MATTSFMSRTVRTAQPQRHIGAISGDVEPPQIQGWSSSLWCIRVRPVHRLHVLVVFLQLARGPVFGGTRRCSELFVWCSRWSCLAERTERETTSSEVFDTKNVPSHCAVRHFKRSRPNHKDSLSCNCPADKFVINSAQLGLRCRHCLLFFLFFFAGRSCLRQQLNCSSQQTCCETRTLPLRPLLYINVLLLHSEEPRSPQNTHKLWRFVRRTSPSSSHSVKSVPSNPHTAPIDIHVSWALLRQSPHCYGDYYFFAYTCNVQPLPALSVWRQISLE